MVSRLLGLAQVSWATARVGVHMAFSPSHSISGCFSIHSSAAIGFQSYYFFTTNVSAPFRSTLHFANGEFPRLHGTGSGTPCCGPGGGALGAHEAEISFQMFALAGV